MQRAYDDVTANGLSISEAARQHNVPRTTLSDRIQRRIPVECHFGRQRAFSPTEKTLLVDYTSYMHEHIFPISKMQVMGLAREIDKAKGSENCVFSENGSSNKWWRWFKSRHPGLCSPKPEAVDRGRIHNATKDNIDDFLNKSTSIIHKNNSRPESTTATRLLST